MEFSPIVLFVYNRPWHTAQTTESLRKNELAGKSELFIFSDAPGDNEQIEKVAAVRQYLKTIDGFKQITIIEREENLGLANSIISGVTDIVNRYGKVIVLEDDLLLSPYFLSYMNNALNLYENEEKVMHVSGYVFPLDGELPETFFLRGLTASWGWGTWKRAWSMFNPNAYELLALVTKREEMIRDFDLNGSYDYLQMLRGFIEGKNNSWAIRWYASVFLAGGYALWPSRSLVRNIGFDDSGTHCDRTDVFYTKELTKYVAVNKAPVVECVEGKLALIHFFEKLRKDAIGPIRKAMYRLRHIVYGVRSYIPIYLI